MVTAVNNTVRKQALPVSTTIRKAPRSRSHRAMLEYTSRYCKSSKYSGAEAQSSDMTNWRAVGIGFLVQVVLGLVGFALPGIGHAAAGLLGGFAAGYVAAEGMGSGAWHGLLAGAIGGILLGILVAVGITIIGTLSAGPLGPILGGATFVAAVVIALILAIDSAIGGLVGGLIAREA